MSIYRVTGLAPFTFPDGRQGWPDGDDVTLPDALDGQVADDVLASRISRVPPAGVSVAQPSVKTSAGTAPPS